MMIPPDIVASIHDNSRIEEVVGEYVSLKKRGANLLGLCPFHNEKTPSFTVSPTKGIYKCFGCGKAGNSVKFVMEHEQLSYPEALRHLAKRYNIEIEEINTEEARAEQHLYDSLYITNQFALEYFVDTMFNTNEGKSVGLSYFKERGYRDETIEKFQLGYTLNSFDGLYNKAKEKGFKDVYLEKLGLAKEKNNRRYDFFRARVMFPIQNLSGKVIAFAGRTLSTDKKVPKYVNSPESEIYYKSKILYGAYHAKKSIRQEDNCFLVEGYTDVISLHQAGIENVVASSGTSLTNDQIRLIKRFTPNITVLYDGDKAGINAALRGTDMILEAGLNVKVVLLPDGEDPDSYINKVGKAAFLEHVEQDAKDFVFFKTNLLVEQAQNDPVKKTRLIRSIVETLAKIPDPIKRSLYIRECSRLMEVEESIIINEANKIKHGKFNDYVSQGGKKRPNNGGRQASPEMEMPQQQGEDKPKIELLSIEDTLKLLERDIVTILFNYGHLEFRKFEAPVALYVLNELAESSISFLNPLYAQIIQIYLDGINQELLYDTAFFKNHENPEIAGLCANLIADGYSISDNWKKMHEIVVPLEADNFEPSVENLMNRFKLKHLVKLMDENQEKMKTSKDEEEVMKCIKIHQHLLESQATLAKILGIVIIR